MYKLFMLSYFLKRKINTKKIYINLFTNGVPTVILFWTIQTQLESIHHIFRFEGFSDHIQFIYINYMIVNRIVRAGLRIRKVLNKSKIKALLKKESKEKKLKEEQEALKALEPKEPETKAIEEAPSDAIGKEIEVKEEKEDKEELTRTADTDKEDKVNEVMVENMTDGPGESATQVLSDKFSNLIPLSNNLAGL